MGHRSEIDVAMERYAAGDESAFARIYDGLAPRLFGYLVRRTGEASRAEDVLQQTLLQIHRARGSFVPGAPVLPWAFAIAQRALIDSVRRGPRERLTSDGEPGTETSSEPPADVTLQARQLANRVTAAVSRLPPSQRAAFELVRGEELSMSEAARVLGTSVTAVKLRAHRAYVALRRTLAED